MNKALVIVESPAKARTISKCLGSNFIVESSIGHIRDLPSTAAEIPAKFKDQPWARLGVNVDEGFKPLYVIPKGKSTQVKKLKSQLKTASELYLATDVDREGEAIAWHLVQVLNPKCPVKRMAFEEITQTAILKAVQDTREINSKLVTAQETRRILDRLYGYEVSPVLWRKVKPKLSAGRVQSVATRLVVAREQARIRFVQAEYWGVEAELKPQNSEKDFFQARLVELDGKKIASSKDFDETTGRLKKEDEVLLLKEEQARNVAADLKQAKFSVSQVKDKPFTSSPYAPFITSTLQQEAARKLRFSAQRTMRVAQKLYESGYITYMRTDSIQLSGQAINAARNQVAELYGKNYLPDKPRIFKRKSKNAQEAHEAIRPAGEAFRTPDSLRSTLDSDGWRLYELIWKRTVASQMKDAKGMRTQVLVEAKTAGHGLAALSSSGKVITFPGFLRAYVEGSDDPQADLADQEKILPALTEKQPLDLVGLDSVQHITMPPARYTEASLIKELEERGIGRPSTYATILQTIQDRGYVWKKSTSLVPTFIAFAVVSLLERHLPALVDYDFTAKMEDGLDAIANGKQEANPWLYAFYFGKAETSALNGNGTGVGLKAQIEKCSEAINAREISSVILGRMESGAEVAVRVGRYGAYVQIGDTDQRAQMPDEVIPDEFTVKKALELLEKAAQGDRVLGRDPETSQTVYLKTGRFGPYVQLGDPELTEKGKIKRGTKPKMASLWPGMSVETITLEVGMRLLSFPRELGKHPETGEVITAQNGRFGPYLKMGTDSRSLPNHEMLATVTLEEAIEIYRKPKGTRGKGRSAVLKELGKHKERGDQVMVKIGRYGPYVTDGVVNAPLPKGKEPGDLTLEEAIKLIQAREERLKEQGKDPRAPKATKKKTAKKSTKSKSAEKE
ncbi:MAG: type I DNA topoisomerase [Planctomycetes bacterium]|nr:type I DNA topoisomerase [Planctomycetota bacterium]